MASYYAADFLKEGVSMTRPVRKMETLLFLAMINAGCAQMSGTYLPAEPVAALPQWPTPVIDQSAAPVPSEPVYLQIGRAHV